MPSLPSSLALTNIADSASIISSDHRNNYAAIQTGFNSLLTALTVTAKGDLLVASASGAISNVVVGANGTVLAADSTQANGVKWAAATGSEVGYDQITASVNIASTTEATGTTIITCGAHAFDGAPVMAEFFAPEVLLGTTAGETLTVSLFEGATQIGRLCVFTNTSGAQSQQSPVVGRLRFTPTAASHTYTATAFASVLTGPPSVQAGVGGTGALVPAFVRFTKV